jgi:hypothetical protein
MLYKLSTLVTTYKRIFNMVINTTLPPSSYGIGLNPFGTNSLIAGQLALQNSLAPLTNTLMQGAQSLSSGFSNLFANKASDGPSQSIAQAKNDPQKADATWKEQPKCGTPGCTSCG